MKIIEECIERTSITCERKPERFCCKEMKQVFDKEYKRHYDDGSGNFTTSWGITKECKISIPIRTSSGYNGDCSVEFVNLRYCPFCGERITSGKKTDEKPTGLLSRLVGDKK